MSNIMKDTEGAENSNNEVQAVRGNNYLLLVGINAYKKRPLHNCVKDAEAIRDILLEKYYFEKEHTFEFWEKEASRSKVFAKLRELIKNLSENDNLIIYYSGHGAIDKDLDIFSWITIESESKDESYRITQEEITIYLSKIKVRHLFLIADSCFSGTMFNNTRSEIEDAVEEAPSRWGLSSGRKELVFDGDPGEHSPFATALIEELKTNSEPLGVLQLGESIRRKVAEVTDNVQNPRFDLLRVKGHDGGQLILHPRHISTKKNVTNIVPSIDILAQLPIKSIITYPEIPYKGLSYFNASDARIFFGRSREIRDIYNLLESNIDQRSRLLLLYGQSGIGKSSLLFAGLLPRLPETWLVRYKRRSQDGDAISIIEQFLAEVAQVDCPKAVLIIDQLEEIVYDSGIYEQVQLSKYLRDVMDECPHISIVLSFREEYLSRISNILGWPPESYTNVPLDYLSKAGILEAIQGVTKIPTNINYHNITFDDPDLPLSIAEDFIDLDKKSNTPLLQYVLRRIWDVLDEVSTQEKPFVITRTLYEKLKRGSLNELLDTQLKEVGKEYWTELKNGLLNDLLYFFLSQEITPLSHTISEILGTYRHIDSNTIQLICKKLEDCYLLSSFRNGSGELCYRLCHDALAQPVMLRYLNSQAPGQMASKCLEEAIQRETSLNKDDILIIEGGEFGRRVSSETEESLVNEGKKKFLLLIAKDYIKNNKLKKGLDILDQYFKMFNKIYNELILFQFDYKQIFNDYRYGTISTNEKINRIQNLTADVLHFIYNLDYNTQRENIISSFRSILSGSLNKLTYQLDGLIEIANSNAKNTLNEVFILNLEIIESKNDGVISGEDLLFNYAQLVSLFLNTMLKEYCSEYTNNKHELIFKKIEINFILEECIFEWGKSNLIDDHLKFQLKKNK